RQVPQLAGEYFEIGTPPAYGFYARNVRGLTLNNVRFERTKPEQRPAIVFDNVSDALGKGLSAPGDRQAESLLRFNDTSDVLLTATRVLSPAAALLKLVGSGNESITVEGGDTAKAAKPLVLASGATIKAVKMRME